MLPKSRLYVPIDQFGIGLMNVRDECSKELIRVFLKFIWNSDSNISELIKLTNKNPEGILKRLKKSLGKKLNIDTVLNWISNNESIKNVLKVMELFEQHLSKLYFDNWKSKKSSIFAQHINDKNIDIEVSSKAWKSINIKRNAFIQILKMQDNAMFIGSRKAAILKKPNAKYCYLCKDQICTVNHILLTCPLTKKMQIARYDYICLFIKVF